MFLLLRASFLSQANVSDVQGVVQRVEGGQSVRGPDGYRSGG